MQNEEVPLSIPLSLQQQLEDDCYWISRKEKVGKFSVLGFTSKTLFVNFYYKWTAGGFASLANCVRVIERLLSPLLWTQAFSHWRTVSECFACQSWILTFTRVVTSIFLSVSLVIEILDGLKTYFDFTVSDHLLYSSEVSQYKQLTESASLSPSSIYGAEHLLRLFVRLPQFLCQAGVPAPFIQVLYHHFREFLT